MSRINLFSPSLDEKDSYGLIATQLCRHLTDLGITVNATGWSPDIDSAQTIPANDGSIWLGWPTMFPAWHVEGGPNIAITMFESSKIPASWVAILNKMDAVIVPSRFCMDVFAQCGVTALLHLFPLGISDAYQPVERKANDVTTFLAFLDRGRRKGGLVALEAFQMAFGGDPHYQLVLKIRKPGRQVELLGSSNIRLIQQDMSEQELNELYCSCDCLVAANSGEGFGILPREFAATGGIALATNWGGTADDIDSWGIPLPYTLGKADWTGFFDLEGQDLGDWAIPDVQGVADLMCQVADNRTWYLAQASNAPREVRKLYSWQRFGEQVHEVWRDGSN